jgi:hypothetical protein
MRPWWRVRWGEIPIFLCAIWQKCTIVMARRAPLKPHFFCEPFPSAGMDILLWPDRKAGCKEVSSSDDLHWRCASFPRNWWVVHRDTLQESESGIFIIFFENVNSQISGPFQPSKNRPKNQPKIAKTCLKCLVKWVNTNFG